MKPSSGDVVSVARAFAILDAFGLQDSRLSLAELARRTVLPKSSVLRIARTLKSMGYLVQMDHGAWRLGPAAAWLGARYQVAFDLDNTIEPVVQQLATQTKETISFFVHDGNMRSCLVRAKGARALASTKLKIGEPAPLDKGSPGHVILAFTGREGALYDEIRRRGFHVTVSEFKQESASVSAPVFGATWTVVGALTLAGPASRLTKAKLLAFAPTIVRAARRLSYELSGGTAKSRMITTSSIEPLLRRRPPP